MLSFALIALLVASAKGFSQGLARATIDSISPQYGSLAGGTMITLRGSGFQRGGIVGSTDVYIGALRCDIEDYYSDDTTLVCKTRPNYVANSGSNPYYRVIVGLHSYSTTQFAQCRTSCWFYYRSDNTPIIYASTPTVFAGGILRFEGYLRGMYATQYDIMVDGKRCRIDTEYTSVDTNGNTVDPQTIGGRRARQFTSGGGSEAVGVSSDGTDTYNENVGATDVEPRLVLSSVYSYGREFCTLATDLEAGIYNYTMNVDGTSSRWGLGDARFLESLVLADYTGSSHVLTVAPKVNNVTSNVSGTNGGHSITITGTGFNPNDCTGNTVLLAGASCEVTSCTNTQIECIAPALSETVLTGKLHGSMGLTRYHFDGEYISNLNSDFFAQFSNPPQVQTQIGGFTFGKPAGYGNRYSQQVSGYFVAPVSAMYTFWVRGDDRVALFFDPSGNGETMVANSSRLSDYYGSGTTYARSTSFNLTAGQRYPIRAMHSNNGGSYRGFRVAVEIGEDGPPETFQYHRLGEVQLLRIQATHRFQSQRLTITGASSGVLSFVYNGRRGMAQIVESGLFEGNVRSAIRQVYGPICGNIRVSVQGPDNLGNILMGFSWDCFPRVNATDGTAIQYPEITISTSQTDLNRIADANGQFGAASATPEITGTAVAPIGGNFRLQLGNEQTGDIAYSRSSTYYTANNIRAALKRLASVHDVSVGRSGTAYSNAVFTITFRTPQGIDYPTMTVIDDNLVGENARASVSVRQNGRPNARFFDPVPDHMLEVARPNTIAQVTVNGVKGVCNDDSIQSNTCEFAYDADLTAVVRRIRVTPRRDVYEGSNLTFTGRNFDAANAEVTIKVGESACPVVSHTDTEIICTMGHAEVGDYVPTVLLSTTGYADINDGQEIAYEHRIDSISPINGSWRGGTEITITGSGFSPNMTRNNVIMDSRDYANVPCDVVFATYSVLKCITRSMPIDDVTYRRLLRIDDRARRTDANVLIGLFDNANAGTFSFEASLTPSVETVSPLQFSAALTTPFTFTGPFAELGWDAGSAVSGCQASADLLGSDGTTYECEDVVANATHASCTVAPGAIFDPAIQTTVFPRLKLCKTSTNTSGYAHPEPGFSNVDAALRIESLSPFAGSLAGGTNITMTGAGFVRNTEQMVRSALTYNYFSDMVVVNISFPDRNVPCVLTFSNFTHVECTTQMPTSNTATLTSEQQHTYDGGYNGFAQIGINDFVVPGCVPQFGSVSTGPSYFAVSTGSWCNNDNSFCYSYAPQGADQILFSMNGTAPGYIALGFADDANSMGPADVAMCRVTDSGVQVEDRFNPYRGSNTLDARQNLVAVSGSVDTDNNHISCSFIRYVNAPGGSDDRALLPGDVNIIWALGQSISTGPQRHTSRGAATVSSFLVDATVNTGFSIQVPPHHDFSARTLSTPFCGFDFTTANTPTINSVAPTSVSGATQLTITGDGFTAGPIVHIGRYACSVTSQSSTQIVCDVSAMSAGEHMIQIYTDPNGLAAHPSTPISVTSVLRINTVTPRVSSRAGGLLATISGSGFSTDDAGSSVFVGGRPAHVVSSTPNALVFISPPVLGGASTETRVESIVVTVGTEVLPEYAFGQLEPTTFNYFDSRRIVNPPDSARRYSSTYGNRSPPSAYTSSMLDNAYGWLPVRSSGTHWVQMDLGESMDVVGVVTLGRGNANQYVSRFRVQVSQDGSSWTAVPGTFEGSDSRTEQLTTEFGTTFNARFIRIFVVSYYSYPAMRVGALVINVPAASVGSIQLPGSYSISNALMQMTYNPTATPTITSVSPSSGVQGTAVTVSGTRLDGAGMEILIGNVACAITSQTATSAVCTLGPSPAGPHQVYVTVPSSGTASGIVTFTSEAHVSSISPISGSFGGGTMITIEGQGFGGGSDSRRIRRQDGAWSGWYIYDVEEEDGAIEYGTKVSICGAECVVTGSTYTSLNCTTGRATTVESMITYEMESPTLLTPTRGDDSYNGLTLFTSNSGNDAYRVFDNDMTSDWSGDYVGFDLGADTLAVASKIRFFPRHQYATSVEGGVFEVSMTSGANSWTPLAWARNVHQGWNYVVLDHLMQRTWRYMRFRSVDGNAQLTQIQVYGVKLSASNECPVVIQSTKPLSHPSQGPMTTDHDIFFSNASAVSFTYATDNTPVVANVEPRFGSSLGGTTVNVTGTGFPSSTSDLSIIVNGIACDVISVTATLAQCVTGPRGGFAEMQPTSLQVIDHRTGHGNAMVPADAVLRYLDRWSDVTTWLNNEPPRAGDSVVVPEDQTLLLDVQPPRLFALIVHGVMVFDRRDLNLDASYILIQGGKLEVGTEEEPFLQQATITLHGDRRKSIEIPMVGAKMIAVADKGGFTTHGQGRGGEVQEQHKGTLDIHGKPRIRTWTKVEEGIIEANTRVITTVEPTDFEPGEKIVLTAPHQELTVASRINTTAFTVVENITDRHISEIRRHVGDGGDFTLDMRVEVALLSRNILIQGAGAPRLDGTPTITEDDDEVNSTAQLFGVHTGAFHGGYYRIENTEFRHCGQAGNLGRYCTHFHVNDENPAPNSYVKSNSIHHSFQRAVTVHKTHHALVQNNVAYHVMGHTYFVEDGDEMFNTFDSNIGIFTRPSHMMLKSDLGPATFWTAIPDNYWRNNIATDSMSRGAWFELTHQGQTLEFRNNSFHHNKGIGFRNYPNYSPPSPQYFYNNSYFKNGGNGLFYKKGGDNHHVFSKFAENGIDIFWKKYSTHETSRFIPNVHDCVFWGKEGGRSAQAIFAPQHEYFYVNGSTFINYENNGVLSACAGCCSPVTMRQGAYTYRFERLYWVNSSKRTKWTCPYKQIMHDLDGTLTGYAGGTALPYYKFNEWDGNCVRDQDTFGAGGWNAGGMVCNSSVRVRRLQIKNHAPRALDRKAISFKKSESLGLNDEGIELDRFGRVDWNRYASTGILYENECRAGDGFRLDFSGCGSMDGLDWINYRVCNSDYSGWAVPMVTHHDYYADIDWHIDFQKLTMRWSEPFYLRESYNKPLSSELAPSDPESVLLRFPYVDYRYKFRNTYGGDIGNGGEFAWFDKFSNRTTAFSRSESFGNGYIMRQDETLRTTGTGGEWKVAINPWDGVNLTTVQSNDPLVMNVQALQCAPEMCGLPGTIPDTWDGPYFWSNPSTWSGWTNNVARRINSPDVLPTGVAPVAGERVEVPEGMWIKLDISNPPHMSKLVVSGRLTVEVSNDAAALHVDRMLVWGIFEVGTPSNRYINPFTLHLHGLRTSPTLVATDQHFLGNKNLVVFGRMTMYAENVPNRWTTLAQTAAVNATSVTVTDANGWRVGDQIVIAPTEYPEPVDIYSESADMGIADYSAHQDEIRTVTAVNGGVLTFTGGLSHRHFAGEIETGTGTVRLAAHVGRIASNLQIRGAIEDTPVAGEDNWYEGYGGHIVVGEVNFGSQERLNELREAGEDLSLVQKLGSMRLSGVQLSHMGKLASEHPAVVFKYFTNLSSSAYPTNIIENCAFSDTYNHAVSAVSTPGLVIRNNFVHKSFKSGIKVDLASRDISIDDNLVIGNQRSPDAYDPRCRLDGSCWNHPFASFMIWNKHMTSLSGNIAAGAEDTGFIMYPLDDCDATTYTIHDNVAYAGLVGGYLLSAGVRTCRTLTQFTAWKNAHIGIVTVDQSANMVLDRVTVADNHEGISLNFVQKGIDAYSTLINSNVIGSSEASTCSESIDCRAVTAGDERGLRCNSEFGSSWRRIGIVMPQYTNLAKTCEASGELDICDPPNTVFRICSLPWENRFGNPDVQYAKFTITNTSFAHWNASDCGRTSRAIALNPSQPDFTAETFMSNITWADSVDEMGRLNMGDTTYQTHEATACGRSCDAVNYFQIKDLDGTTFDLARFWDDWRPGEALSMHSDSNPPSVDPNKCRADSNRTGAIVCRDFALSRLVFESNPPRFTTRRIGPVTIARYGEDVADNRTSWSVGPFPQGCSCQKHFAQFHYDTQPGQNYDIHSTGVLEDTNRITYMSDNSSECILTKIMFSKPQPVEVVRVSDGAVIPALVDGTYPSLTNAMHTTGTNILDPQERMLYLKLCGGQHKQFWLRYIARVQVTAILSMSYDEFFANAEVRRQHTEVFVTNLATLLQINPANIRVVCVHRAGQPCTRERRSAGLSSDMTALDLEIYPDQTEIITVMNGTIDVNVSISDDRQHEQLSGIYNLILGNESGLIQDLVDQGVPVASLLSSNFTNLVSSTTTTVTTATVTSTITGTTRTSTTTTTGSRTSTSTSETFTSTSQTTQVTSTVAVTTLPRESTTSSQAAVDLASSVADSDDSNNIVILAIVLSIIAVIIVVAGVYVVRRSKPKDGYDLGVVPSSPDQGTFTFIEGASTMAETDVDESVVNPLAFKASQFQDSLRVVPGKTGRRGVRKLDNSGESESDGRMVVLDETGESETSGAASIQLGTAGESETSGASRIFFSEAGESESNGARTLMLGSTEESEAGGATSMIIGGTHANESEVAQTKQMVLGGLNDTESEAVGATSVVLQDVEEIEDVSEDEEELPAQFFGQRNSATKHTNLELNPAFFGRRGSGRGGPAPIQPDVLDDEEEPPVELEEEPNWEEEEAGMPAEIQGMDRDFEPSGNYVGFHEEI